MERVRSESSLPPLQSETMAGGGCTSSRRCKGLFGSLDMARDQRISHLVSSKAVFTHVPSGHKIISKCGVIVWCHSWVEGLAWSQDAGLYGIVVRRWRALEVGGEDSRQEGVAGGSPRVPVFLFIKLQLKCHYISPFCLKKKKFLFKWSLSKCQRPPASLNRSGVLKQSNLEPACLNCAI